MGILWIVLCPCVVFLDSSECCLSAINPQVMQSMRHNQWSEDLRLEEQDEAGPGGGSDDEGLLETQMLEGVHSSQGPAPHSTLGLHVPGIAVSKVRHVGILCLLGVLNKPGNAVAQTGGRSWNVAALCQRSRALGSASCEAQRDRSISV